MSLPVTSGLQLWFSADQITGKVDGDTVASWTDQSPNGNTATLQTGTLTYHTNKINGLPSLTFASAKLTFASALTSSGQHTIFVVFKLASTAAGSALFGGPTAALFYYLSFSGKMQATGGQNFIQVGTGTAAPDTSWHQSNLVYSGSGSTPGFVIQFRLDQSVDTATNINTSAGTNFTEPTTLGSSGSGTDFFNGEIAEVIYYNRNLSSTEVGQMESYVNTKYFVTAPTVSDQPMFFVMM